MLGPMLAMAFAAYAPGGALGAAHHDDDLSSPEFGPTVTSEGVLRALGSENFVLLSYM